MNDLLVLAPVLLQVLLIDLVLAGDNAVVIGLAVNGLPSAQRRRAIWAGVAGATLIRIGFALVALKMLALIGLTLAGGILLLWVVWKSARELRHADPHAAVPPTGRLSTAIWRIIIADVSMSLDNVLAVAVALMGLAAGLIARLFLGCRIVAAIMLAPQSARTTRVGAGP